jgi:hypothetical protein
MINQNINAGMVFSTNPNVPPYNQGQNVKAPYPYPSQNPAVRPQMPNSYGNMPTSQPQYSAATNPMMYGNYSQPPRGGQPYYLNQQQNPSGQVPMIGNTYLQYPPMTSNPYPQPHPQAVTSSNQSSQQPLRNPSSDTHNKPSNATSQSKQYQGNQVSQPSYSNPPVAQHQFSAIGSTPINPPMNYYHTGQPPIYAAGAGTAPNSYYQYVSQGRGPNNPTGVSNQEKGQHSTGLPNSGVNPSAAYPHQQYSMNQSNPSNVTYQSNPSSYPYQNPSVAQQQYHQTIGGKIVDPSTAANSVAPQQFVPNNQPRPGGYPPGYNPAGNQYYSHHAPVPSQQMQPTEKNTVTSGNSQGQSSHTSVPPKNS